jgi:hypothetical protein
MEEVPTQMLSEDNLIPIYSIEDKLKSNFRAINVFISSVSSFIKSVNNKFRDVDNEVKNIKTELIRDAEKGITSKMEHIEQKLADELSKEA